MRLTLVKQICNINGKLICPTHELETYWDRHFSKIEKTASALATEIRKYDFVNIINSVVSNYLDMYPNTVPTLSLEILERMKGMNRLTNITSDIQEKQRVKLAMLFSEQNKGVADIFEIEKILFNTLNNQFIKNLRKVTLLKRSWKDGKVLANYNELNMDILYAIDQTGGVFFYESQKVDEYFFDNAECLLELINFSLIKKKEFILKQQRYA